MKFLNTVRIENLLLPIVISSIRPLPVRQKYSLPTEAFNLLQKLDIISDEDEESCIKKREREREKENFGPKTVSFTTLY